MVVESVASAVDSWRVDGDVLSGTCSATGCYYVCIYIYMFTGVRINCIRKCFGFAGNIIFVKCNSQLLNSSKQFYKFTKCKSVNS